MRQNDKGNVKGKDKGGVGAGGLAPGGAYAERVTTPVEIKSACLGFCSKRRISQSFISDPERNQRRLV